ncbi:MAG: ROK family protein, partial [Halanaerobiales bacterium]
NTAGFYLGVGLGNLINLFNPEMVLFGGGVSRDFDIFSERMLSVARKIAMSSSFASVEVKPAALSDEVGLLGAVALAVKSGT